MDFVKEWSLLCPYKTKTGPRNVPRQFSPLYHLVMFHINLLYTITLPCAFTPFTIFLHHCQRFFTFTAETVSSHYAWLASFLSALISMRCDLLLTILKCCTTFLLPIMIIGEAPPLLYPQVMIYSVTLTGSDKFLFLSRVIQPRHLSGLFTPQGHACCNTACDQRLSVFFLWNDLLLRYLVIAYIRSMY